MTLETAIRDMEAWARNAGTEDRDLPENLGLDRETGFPISYEQIGGNAPERQLFNQLFYEISACIVNLRDNGLPLPWNQDVNYRHPAFAKGEDGLVYVTTGSNTGPATGNSTNPTDEGQTVWRRH